MKRNLRYVRAASREEWLRLRAGSVGGSEAAAVLNEHEYTDAYALWCEKTGRVSGFAGNEAARLGTELEDYAARRFCEIMGAKRGAPVRARRVNRTIFNPIYPFAHANVDRTVVGENAVLECKTVGAAVSKDQRTPETMPRMWYWQIMHYIAVGGYDRGYLSVVDRTGRDAAFVVVVERDEAAIRRLMNAEEAFMRRVRDGDAPDPAGMERDRAVNRERWPVGNAELEDLQLDPSWAADLKRRGELKSALAETERAIRAIDAKLQREMGDHTRATCGGYVIRWKPQTIGAIDREALLRDHPAFPLDRYRSTARVLRVSEK